jgi:hypothetical protein
LKNLFIGILLSQLLACSQLPMPPESSTKTVEFPAAHLVKCPPLEEVSTTDQTLGSLIEYLVGVMTQYNECAVRHDSLVDMLKQENSLH